MSDPNKPIPTQGVHHGPPVPTRGTGDNAVKYGNWIRPPKKPKAPKKEKPPTAGARLL